MNGPARMVGLLAILGAGVLAGFFGGRTAEPDTALASAPPAAASGAVLVSDVATPPPAANALQAPQELSASEQHTIRLFEQTSPSVVNVTSIRIARDFFTRNVLEVPRGAGTGFVWDERGHIVTNWHVVQGGSAARVTLSDQSTWDARLVGAAPEKDLAVLRIDAPASRLRSLPIGRSNDLRVGQAVYAIGNPFGLDQTLTTGIISALGREINSLANIPIRDVIQTDAAINPGNSGGPLLNSSGELVGVNTAIYSPSGAYAGIGFAIPVDVVRWVVPDLIAYGEVRRPSLGVEIAPDRIAQDLGVNGALVLYVEQGSAADRAGIRPTRRNARGEIELGDVLIAIDGVEVDSFADVVLALERRTPGETVLLTIVREGQRREVRATLGSPRTRG